MVEWCVHFLLFKEYFLVSDAYISHGNVELCVAHFKLKIRALLRVQIKKSGCCCFGQIFGMVQKCFVHAMASASKQNINNVDSLKYSYLDPLPGIVGCCLTYKALL